MNGPVEEREGERGRMGFCSIPPMPNHPTDEDLSPHPNEQKSFVGDPESVGTLAAPTPTQRAPRSPDGAPGKFGRNSRGTRRGSAILDASPPRRPLFAVLIVHRMVGYTSAMAWQCGFCAEKRPLTIRKPRVLFGFWLLVIVAFALLHALHLRADFPNHSPWAFDWAKYTDEGWYGNAAIRAHLFGPWYVAGDFNPAVALPVLPFLEWLLFFVTGVTPEAARALSVAFFFADLVLSYLLIRSAGPRWAAYLAVTLMVMSPFLYCFSRLAILEPILMTFELGALNIAVRLPELKWPVRSSAAIGLLFTVMMLTKTTAIFLLPAVAWAMLIPLRRNVFHAVRCALAAIGAFALSYGLWLSLVAWRGLWSDYQYMYTVNAYAKPGEFYWPLVSAVWSFHGGLWADHILVPLAGIVLLFAALSRRTSWSRASRVQARTLRAERRRDWGSRLFLDPVLGASALSVAGYLLFMAVQNHPQPRYFTVVGMFCFIVIAREAQALLDAGGVGTTRPRPALTIAGAIVIGVAVLAAGLNGARLIDYALHPEYTFVNAAGQLARYVDVHPNGKRLLVSISGDELSLINHVPALCDDFVSPNGSITDLPAKTAYYQPGWYASWNDLDPGTLEDLHTHFSLEQVATFAAFDDPERNHLVLFKLHPLPGGEVRDPAVQNLKDVLPDDSIQAPLE